MMKTVILIFLAVMLAANTGNTKEVLEHILIVPAGDVDKNVIDKIKSDLPDLWPVGMSTEVFPREELPESARNTTTGQYDAAAILGYIADKMTIVPATERILIVTGADIFTHGGEAVSGIADQKKGAAIISTARLDNRFYGQAANERLLRERSLKEALRESAHCRGLEPCSNMKCAMSKAKTLAETDKKRAKLCTTCYNKLYGKYGTVIFKMPVL